VVFFDIGQGDSALIRTAAGEDILIDGGPDKTVLEKLGNELPFYDRTIELMVLTHPHADHVTGLVEVLKRYKVEKVMLTNVSYNTPAYAEFLNIIRIMHIDQLNPVEVRKIYFTDLTLNILYPFQDLTGQEVKDLNDSSVVILAEHEITKIQNYNNVETRFIASQKTKYLFTGDIGVGVEQEILERYVVGTGLDPSLKVDVLKVAHQGSTTSSLNEFIQAVNPQIAVISVGENDFGHPSLRVIRRLKRAGAQVLRTDEMGDIKITSDKLPIKK